MKRTSGIARLTVIVLLAAGVMAVLFAVGYLPKLETNRRALANARQGPKVLPEAGVVAVQRAPSEFDLTLPGTIQSDTEAPLYARADGYVRRRLVDIGDRVSAGQLLAEIDSPEQDQQIREAEAGVRRSESMERQSGHVIEQARANRELARVTHERWSLLVTKGVLAKQEGDEKRSAYVARQADAAAAESGLASAREALAASQAALGRLREMQQFRKVVAPFGGVITARNIEVGSLVGAGSSSAVRELFRIAKLSVLKVQVNVPQSEVQLIRVGTSVEATVDELPRQIFAGRVVRTASTLDPASRTLLTEVSLPNPGGKLLPGMYANLVFHLRRPDPPILVPATALLLGAQGTRLAVVGQGGKIHYQSVTVGRDYGAQVEVVSGIAEGQKVVMNVTDEMPEGTPVKPIPLATKKGPGKAVATPKGGAQ